MTQKLKMTKSSGNVYRDIGFSEEESQDLIIRSKLMRELKKRIEQVGLTQAKAAELINVTQPRISDLSRGKISLFSTEALIGMLAKLGGQVSVSVKFKRAA
jgi:predicted XRE-type DNA-binding protein